MEPVSLFDLSAARERRRTPLAEASLHYALPKGGPAVRRGEPVRLGVPFARGACRSVANLTLETAAGPAPLQARALDRWCDGSVRWALLDYCADVHFGRHHGSVVSTGPRMEPDAVVRVMSVGAAVHVDTGRARFTIVPNSTLPFAAVRVDGAPALDVSRCGLHAEDESGRRLLATVERVRVEDSGPIRAVVCSEGRLASYGGNSVIEFTCRTHFTAGSATVRIDMTLRNPNRAFHPGGIWELGDPGSVYLRDMALTFAAAAGDERRANRDDHRDAMRIRCSPEIDSPFEECAAPFELFQESSGGENWRSRVHVNRDRVVPHERQGYVLRAGERETTGLRATPVVTLEGPGTFLGLTVPAFWQNFPAAVESDGTGVTLRVWPRQYPDVHELQGGEQKTFTCYLAVAADTVTDEPLAWCRAPLFASVRPDAYCESGAVPYLLPEDQDPYREYTTIVREGLEGESSFARKREAFDEYGWRHFGDLPADHESALLPPGAMPFVSHYNNQYDAIFGFACHFMRTRDPRWWLLMDELASHVVDIDIYHTDRDRAAYNHGLFWHTSHYVDAGAATHRSFPNADGVIGGGPSAEQNYTSGLLLHYFLTGDPRSRAAVVELAEWVIAMDDGRKSPFWWLAGGDTGLASATNTPCYHGPGRGGAHSINALIDGHRITGDRRFLDKAEQLIRRCIHPDDDIAALELQDPERRWSYTAFLQILGSYLDYKVERGEIDAMHGYARASLLRYGHWIAAHEYPYLDKPEILEFPTETWAAQDIRKSVVLDLAAKYAEAADWSRFRERSEFFYRTALATLSAMPTRAMSRPLVLLLSYGFVRGHERVLPSLDMASADRGVLPPRQVFVPQKTRAIRRVRWVTAAAALLVAPVTAMFRWTWRS
jgi:YetA-like protein